MHKHTHPFTHHIVHVTDITCVTSCLFQHDSAFISTSGYKNYLLFYTFQQECLLFSYHFAQEFYVVKNPKKMWFLTTEKEVGTVLENKKSNADEKMARLHTTSTCMSQLTIYLYCN